MSDVFYLPNDNDRLELDKFLPYKLSFIESKKREDSFMYSSLYCLTNTELYMKRFLPIIKTEISKGEKDYAFFDMMNNIYEDIKSNECKEHTLNQIKKFKDSLGNKNNDPRLLIRYILADLLTPREIFTEIKKTNSGFYTGSQNDNFLSIKNEKLSLNDNLDISLIKSYDWTDKIQDIENKEYNIIIKKTNNEGKSEYGLYNFIKLYLSEENKEYTLEKCLKEYLNLADEQLLTNVPFPKKLIFGDIDKKIYYKLPKSIIIFIYYQKNEIDEENPQNYFYNFKEILDLSNADFIDKDTPYKKYFLSSLIVCKFPKIENKKFYYTYCRKNKDSNYIIFNSKDKDIRDINEKFKFVSKILKREKNDKLKSAKSYPYVLVYTAV